MKTGFEKYKDELHSLRYARILNEILSNISIVIDEDDLIVSRVKETIPTAKDRRRLQEIAEYYDMVCPGTELQPNRNVKIGASLEIKTDTEIDRAFFESIAYRSWFSTAGHITVAWDILLEKGVEGIRDLAQVNLAAFGKGRENSKKREFLEAVTVSCDAVIGYAKRYEEAFAKLAKDAVDQIRKDDFLKISEVLHRVPGNPARSFREALQAVWFLDLIMHTVCGARDYALGRMDQYLYKYYKNDVEQGILSRDDAIELLQNVFIHTVEISGIGDHTHGSNAYRYTSTMPIKQSRSRDSVQYLILGGQTLDGRDACNELSSVILDAFDEIRTKTPNITIRYHDGIDREFWLKACDMMRRGVNNIGIYNDDVMIAALEKCGVLPDDSINYAHYGCCNPCIPGKDAQLREDQLNLAKILELTLNDGFDPIKNVQLGPHTGTIDAFEIFDDLMEAFTIQMKEDVARAVENKVGQYVKYVKDRPFSFESCLLEGCVEAAMDCNDPQRNPIFGGPGYIHHNIDAAGLATAADSLAAIKKLVYDDKEITFSELKEALDDDFEGHEMLRLRMLNKCPKFGNDDDYVDAIAAEIGYNFCSEVVKHDSKHPALGQCWPQLYSYHRYRSCGLETGATPDGRKAGEPVSENHGPTSGNDRKGLSALLNSMSKLHEAFSLTPGGGATINMHPTTIMVDEGEKIIANTIETYFEKGGMHIQINVVDKATLVDAQNHPEKHRDLLVRVTGYSAYFVTLSPESQNNIIARFPQV